MLPSLTAHATHASTQATDITSACDEWDEAVCHEVQQMQLMPLEVYWCSRTRRRQVQWLSTW